MHAHHHELSLTYRQLGRLQYRQQVKQYYTSTVNEVQGHRVNICSVP